MERNDETEAQSTRVVYGMLIVAVLIVIGGVTILLYLKHRLPPTPNVRWNWPSPEETLQIPTPPGLKLFLSLDEIIDQIKSGNEELNRRAIYALMMPGHDTARVLPLLRSKVVSKNKFLKAQIAVLCGSVKAIACNDLLSVLVHDDDPFVKLEALKAVASLPGPLSADLLFELRASLAQAEKNGSPQLAVASAGTLAKHGSPKDAAHSVGILIDLLRHFTGKEETLLGHRGAKESIVIQSSHALRELGERATAALPVLLAALKEFNSSTHANGIVFDIARIPGMDDAVIPVLIEVWTAESSPAAGAMVWEALSKRAKSAPTVVQKALKEMPLSEGQRKQVEQLLH